MVVVNYWISHYFSIDICIRRCIFGTLQLGQNSRPQICWSRFVIPRYSLWRAAFRYWLQGIVAMLMCCKGKDKGLHQQCVINSGQLSVWSCSSCPHIALTYSGPCSHAAVHSSLRYNGIHSHTQCRYMDYYSFTEPGRPGGRGGRLSWPSWLTHSGQFTHKVVTC